MKGPALLLKNYLRCRKTMSHGEWVILLAVASKHGLWISRGELMKMPVRTTKSCSTAVRVELAKLQAAGLVEVRTIPARTGGQLTNEARITNKGLYFLGWPELTVPDSPSFDPAVKA